MRPDQDPVPLLLGTKPYKFIGLGAMDAAKTYKFIGFGAMDVAKPYKFIGFVAVCTSFLAQTFPNPIQKPYLRKSGRASSLSITVTSYCMLRNNALGP
jgi:hypothetical protein